MGLCPKPRERLFWGAAPNPVGDFFWGAAPNPARGLGPLDPHIGRVSLLAGEVAGVRATGCSCEQASPVRRQPLRGIPPQTPRSSGIVYRGTVCSKERNSKKYNSRELSRRVK